MMYRSQGERDVYDDAKPRRKRTNRQRAGRYVRNVSKKSPIASLGLSIVIVFAVLGALEGIGFSLFHFMGPLTNDGTEASFAVSAIVAPFIAIMFLIVAALAVVIVVNLRKTAVFLLGAAIEWGQDILFGIAKRLDGKERWDEDEDDDENEAS